MCILICVIIHQRVSVNNRKPFRKSLLLPHKRNYCGYTERSLKHDPCTSKGTSSLVTPTYSSSLTTSHWIMNNNVVLFPALSTINQQMPYLQPQLTYDSLSPQHHVIRCVLLWPPRHQPHICLLTSSFLLPQNHRLSFLSTGECDLQITILYIIL